MMNKDRLFSRRAFLFSYFLFFLSVLFPSSCQNTSREKSLQNILRIGTSDRIQSANIFLDSHLTLFAHLSNPPLFKIDGSGKIVGQLIQETRVSEDHTSWELVIKDNLFWSDGRKLTAEDVQFSIVYTGEKNPAAGWLKESVAEITVENDRTVRILLKKPHTRLDFEFATYKILPKHIWSGIEDPMRYTNEGENIGCGPFFLKRIDFNRGVVLFVENLFWQGQKPAVAGIEIHLFKNKDALSLALEKGDIDACYNYASSYPYPSLKKIRQNGRFTFIEFLNTGLVYLGFNLRKEPMSDIEFREAVRRAIDYREIIDLDILGHGRIPNIGFIPPTMEHFSETPPQTFNRDEAKKFLNDTGYRDVDGNGVIEGKDGRDLKLSILTTAKFARCTELLSSYLLDVGIATEVKTVDDFTWVSLKDRYAYDLVVSRTSPWGMHMHAGWATGYFDARRTGEGVLHTVDDPLFLDLCDTLLSTKDSALLADHASRVQEYYARNLPGIALYWNNIVVPVSRAFRGWISDPLYGIYNIDNFLNIERISR